MRYHNTPNMALKATCKAPYGVGQEPSSDEAPYHSQTVPVVVVVAVVVLFTLPMGLQKG